MRLSSDPMSDQLSKGGWGPVDLQTMENSLNKAMIFDFLKHLSCISPQKNTLKRLTPGHAGMLHLTTTNYTRKWVIWMNCWWTISPNMNYTTENWSRTWQMTPWKRRWTELGKPNFLRTFFQLVFAGGGVGKSFPSKLEVLERKSPDVQTICEGDLRIWKTNLTMSTCQLKHTLYGTNISHQKSCLKMIFLFPKVGYVSSLEGNSLNPIYTNVGWIFLGIAFSSLLLLLKAGLLGEFSAS